MAARALPATSATGPSEMKRVAARGFTLIEVLVTVVIVAVIGLIDFKEALHLFQKHPPFLRLGFQRPQPEQLCIGAHDVAVPAEGVQHLDDRQQVAVMR